LFKIYGFVIKKLLENDLEIKYIFYETKRKAFKGKTHKTINNMLSGPV
jgi:hypothetical protein